MNLNQTLSILFWLNKAKTNSKGLSPIWVRITIDSKRVECSTSKQIHPQHWDAKTNQASPKFPEAQSINEYLLLLRSSITRQYNILLASKDYVSAEELKQSIRGEKEEKKTFLQVFNQFRQSLEERKDIADISYGRYLRFNILYNKTAAYIQHRFKKSDILLDEVKLNFITEFEHYLRTAQKIGHNTAMKYAKDLKQVTRYAVMLGYLTTNPFEFFKCSYKKVKREYLDQRELDILFQKRFMIDRLEEVRDCFLFSCYTGYAYSDAEALTTQDVAIGIDGEKWIIRDRKKTDTIENVPLLPIALQIIEKYKNHPYCKRKDRLLPMNSNQRYNAYLKEIADICGIKKKLTTHTARHTFATTILLSNDIPMETAMELLGHTDIRTTQIYAKVVQKKLSNDMKILRDKLTVTASINNQKSLTT